MLSKIRKKRVKIVFSGVLIINDLMMTALAFILSYWLRFHSNFFPKPLGVPEYVNYLPLALFVEIILIILINHQKLYKLDTTSKYIDQTFSLFKAICFTMLLVLAGTFFYRGKTYSRALIFIIWLMLMLILFFSRYFLRIYYKWKVFPKIRKNVVIIGKPQSIESLLKGTNYFSRFMHVIGFISTRQGAQETIEKIHNLGYIDNFENILDDKKPDEILLADLEIPRRKISSLILESEKRMVSFKIVADLLDIMIQQFELENVEGINLIKIKESLLDHAYNRFNKRIVDFIGSLLGLILLSPVLAIISLLVKLTSRGPVLYAQERVSEGGKIFKIYKFRTMYLDAEAKTGPVFTQVNDQRCTLIGKFLRKYNLDELAQLLNVLKGDMSLVGPRPERPHFVNQFKDDIPRYMSRHNVKSGITGWAQVNGFRQGTSIEERVKYDLYYLENWSIWLDLKIIFLSLLALKNAY